MVYRIERSGSDVDDLIDECARRVNDGENKFFGLTYEAGIEAGIRWLIGEQEEHPLEE